MDRVAMAADAIAAARTAREPLGLLDEAIRPGDEAEAYAIQDAVHERLRTTPIGARVGRKIGCTTPVMQVYLGIPNPCAGGVFAGGVHKSGVRLLADDYRRIGIECEIAVRLARDLAPGGTPCTAESLADAVEAFIPAIEIVDDRYADWRTTDTPTLIADDFFAAGCVLGEPSRAIGPAADIVGVTTINGSEVGRGRGSDVMGHPLNALAWLANSSAERGQPLRQGEIVLTGSLVETKWLDRGDRVTVSISGLGTVELTVG
ncbi:MAG: fumarylacetoacetate hydrolase family protein [Bauldia sp.]|nr:fumarylacetoacetate hydrolase family protein [Bauldia sp.]